MSEVTRAEFEKLAADILDLKVLAINAVDRLSRVERLADGVKDAVCLVASFGGPVTIGNETASMLSFVGRTIDRAQQPAPTAEGAGVEVKSISDPVPLGRCENCGTPYYTLEGFCGTCSPSKL